MALDVGDDHSGVGVLLLTSLGGQALELKADEGGAPG
jgi:hypothetical protein